MKRIFLDSETCGLHSMAVLLQYAEEDGPIELYDIWKEPVRKTLDLIEYFLDNAIVGFNLAFDHFHLCKIYTIWSLLDPDWIPEEHIEEIAQIEPLGRDGPCCKPRSACDLLLWSRKNEFQTLMGRSDIRIRRVPTALAYALAQELERRVEIDGIYFAKNRDKEAPKWRVFDVFKNTLAGQVMDEDFKDVVLKFNAAGGLKFLAEYALGLEPKYHYGDVELPSSYRPTEFGYAPFALAVSSPEKNWLYTAVGHGNRNVRGEAWPAKIKAHIEHWANNEPAREYAKDDIVYTRELYKYFGEPEPGDDDSVLAMMVAAVRWHGFKVDLDGLKELDEKCQKVIKESPVNVNNFREVREYMRDVLDDIEYVTIEESTKKEKLESITNWTIDEEETCTKCSGEGCARCEGGTTKPGPHPAALRAKELLAVKKAVKEVDTYKKIFLAGRFHASFKVIGTLSSRMSGGDGLNAQGIKNDKVVRSQFPLAWEGTVLSIGDFSAFEVTLADAVYRDPKLRRALVEGQKIHALFGMELFPGHTYEEIIESDGTDNDMYTKAKSGVFAMIYGGTPDTLARNLGVPIDIAEAAYKSWGKRFPGIEEARQRVHHAFASMKQPGGIGTAVVWEDPEDYVESFLGDRRYFTLENRICKELFNLAHAIPGPWRQMPIKVVRRDRLQTAAGAVSSALYGAAFSVMSSNVRAAANHEIQSPGARITKTVQRMVWDLQPCGVHEFRVAPANVHDELLVPNTCPDEVAEKIIEGVEKFRDKVPLIGMDWYKYADSWAGKKGSGTSGEVIITYDKDQIDL